MTLLLPFMTITVLKVNDKKYLIVNISYNNKELELKKQQQI